MTTNQTQLELKTICMSIEFKIAEKFYAVYRGMSHITLIDAHFRDLHQEQVSLIIIMLPY